MNKDKGCKGCPGEYDPCLKNGTGDKPAHIIVVGPAPSGFSIGNQTAFFGQHGRLFKQLLSIIKQYNNEEFTDVKVYYTYATAVGAYEPNAEHIAKCKPRLMRQIRSVEGFGGRLPIIVPLGPIAARAVGLQFRKIVDVVGREMTTNIAQTTGTQRYTVIPLLSMKHLAAKIGTANVVLAALLKAVIMAYGKKTARPPLSEITKDYVYPATLDELRELVDHVIAYYDPEQSNGPEQWSIGLDTETNTLKPYSHPDPKVLMVSVAWDDRKAANILLDHPEVPYDPKEAWKLVERLLVCQKPKCFHNWKFDRKFLEVVYGYRVNRVIWDTMLGEHYIDEDKKGHYGLKQLTPIYCPDYEGYDDALHEILRGDEKEDGDEADATSDDGLTPLLLTDVEIVEYDKVNGCPEQRSSIVWEALVTAAADRVRLKAIPKKNRSAGEQKQFEQLKKYTDSIRKQLFVGSPKKKKKDTTGKKVDRGFTDIPLETIQQYAAADADVTRIILGAQVQRLIDAGDWEDAKRVMKYQYLPGSKTLSDMEFRGFAQHTRYRDDLISDVQKRILDVREVITQHFDPSLNLNAPQQVSEYMARMNFETPPGEEVGGTGKELLSKYEEMYPASDPRNLFVRKLLEYREAHKTLTTYLRPYARMSRDDDKIHCQFHLNGTSSGRLSSASPNLQNVPYITARRVKKVKDGEDIIVHPGYNIKRLFIPSRDDYVIVNCDISGAELRVYTAYSHDELMIDALNNGMDVHSMITARVHKRDYADIMAKKETDPEVKGIRTDCKRVVFCTLYGGGAFRVSQITGLSKEKATELQQFLFSALPALRTYIQGVEQEVRRYQQVSTFFGRRRRFRLAHADHRNMAEAIREAVNFKIQSTSSDLVLTQLCEMDDNFGYLEAEMLITVHDSMTFQMPRKNLHKLHGFLDYWITDRVRQKYGWLPVDFKYDVEVGPSYGQVKPFEREEDKGGKEKVATVG